MIVQARGAVEFGNEVTRISVMIVQRVSVCFIVNTKKNRNFTVLAQFYVQYEYWFAAMQLILAMLGMGATLTGKDFRDVVNEPRSVSLGTAIQIVLVPAMAFLFLHLLGVTGGVAVGIAMIAAVPGGTTSNIFTYFDRGNSALSICIDRKSVV